MNLGQLRRSEIIEYTSPIDYNLTEVNNVTNTVQEFYDTALKPVESPNTTGKTKSYYLEFTVKQKETPQNFTVKIPIGGTLTEETQFLKLQKYTTKVGKNSTSYELIFSTSLDFSMIIFELTRTMEDYSSTVDEETGHAGRKMDITIENFFVVNNIIDTYLTSAYPGLKTISRIGVQGPPGMLFCIEGEEIRIGRTGIYELFDEDIKISSIGFVLKDSLFTQNGQDFFIMDFKY